MMSCSNKCYIVHLLCRICRKLDVQESRTEGLMGWTALGAPAWGCFAQGAQSPAGMEGMLCTE